MPVNAFDFELLLRCKDKILGYWAEITMNKMMAFLNVV
jgi:hypothetical protein